MKQYVVKVITETKPDAKGFYRAVLDLGDPELNIVQTARAPDRAVAFCLHEMARRLLNATEPEYD